MKGAAARQLRERQLNNEVSGGVTRKAATTRWEGIARQQQQREEGIGANATT
jgi:hypothetical protein